MEKERELAIQIIDLFENLLDEYQLDIPSKDRDNEIESMTEEEIAEVCFSHLYGDDYYFLEDEITKTCKEFLQNYINKVTDVLEEEIDTYIHLQKEEEAKNGHTNKAQIYYDKACSYADAIRIMKQTNIENYTERK